CQSGTATASRPLRAAHRKLKIGLTEASFQPIRERCKRCPIHLTEDALTPHSLS
ncbi:hypothetical protein AVDCRST_MAG94-804, partial [uncultured Leptolyngbya sp.]